MSSGGRTIVVNNLERAISTDINRLQSFQQRDRSELFRRVLATQYAGLFEQLSASDGTPIFGEILGGLLVRPTTGTFEILIDAGVVAIMHDDVSTDSSNCKVVNETTGVPAATLAITANASGSIRIDVIECRINPVPTTVTDSRDVFDQVTELFTPSIVTKESADRLEFRIRAGTGGAGYPGGAVGWLPLCIASVPNGAVSNNDITFWDVRPLASDRVQFARTGLIGGLGTSPFLKELNARGTRPGANSLIVSGQFQGMWKGRMIGGSILQGVPGSDTGTGLDVGAAINQSSPITEPITVSQLYLYASFPKGLPRWAKYAPHPNTRLPRDCTGIIFSTVIIPDNQGQPPFTPAIPSSTGLGGSIQVDEALCIGVLPIDTLNQFWGHWLAENKAIFAGHPMGATTQQVSASSAYSGGAYNFIPQVWPANIRKLYASFFVTITLAATSAITVGATSNDDVYVYENSTATGARSRTRFLRTPLTNSNAGVQLMTFDTGVLEIPLPQSKYPQDVSGQLIQWVISAGTIFGGAPTLPATAFMSVHGFEL